VVGTGVGQISANQGYYYANRNSNCFWNVALQLNWIKNIPQSKFDFEELMATSEFGFTDIVKDYSGNDNKVLSKYFYPTNGRIKVDFKKLKNESLFNKDKYILLIKQPPS
jgi:hypothetical protein